MVSGIQGNRWTKPGSGTTPGLTTCLQNSLLPLLERLKDKIDVEWSIDLGSSLNWTKEMDRRERRWTKKRAEPALGWTKTSVNS